MTIHRGLTFEEYQAIDAHNWSTIKRMNDSPKHYKYFLGREYKQTPAQLMGSMVHCLVLEGSDAYSERYAICRVTRNAKQGPYKTWLRENPGRVAVKEVEHVMAHIAAEKILAEFHVAALMTEGDPEVSITWTDKATGLPCKGRLDWLRGRRFFDLKVIGTTQARKVNRMIEDNMWYGQQAHYADGLRANGIEDPRSYIVAAEGKGANDVCVVELDNLVPGGALYAGAELRRELMRKLADCLDTDCWPGRHTSVQSVELSRYALPEEDEITYGEEVKYGR